MVYSASSSALLLTMAITWLSGCSQTSSGPPTELAPQCSSITSGCEDCDEELCFVNNTNGSCVRSYATATYAGRSLGTFPCSSCLDTSQCNASALNACVGIQLTDGGTYGIAPAYDGGALTYCSDVSYDGEGGATGSCFAPYHSTLDGGCAATGSKQVASCPTQGLVGCCTTQSLGEICYYGSNLVCAVFSQCKDQEGLFTSSP
jgi:hypothetical protein